ncbi:hypothetical protein [Saccharopolyspora dendranthemae]|uniref:hypothetical protein n=1 Tax=Saccharopolyspora dendranthemae TaxID=1181886 RepID=UPI0011A68BAC|nr:hypothetical protein [Saccharopolyspora dendranthemae]
MVAIALGGSIAVGGGGTAAFEGITAPKPKPRTTQSAKSPLEVEFRAVARWRSRGYQVEVKERSQFGDCDGTAYGNVKRFFAAHPCRTLHRFFADLRKPRNGSVVVAVSTVDMPSVDSAKEYKKLVDKHGTGNVLELPKEFRKYRGVEFTGHRYDSWREDNLVTNIQVEPVAGSKLGFFTITEILSLASS